MLKISVLRQHTVLLAILLGAFTLVLTNSAFNLLLPYFIEHYHISTTVGGWIIALYMLAMTLTMPLASLIVDRLGRKRTYMLGIAIYGGFSVLGALFHTSIEVLLVVRFMHGAAAGLMIPLSLVLLFDVYGPEVRGRITGAWGLLLMLAPAAGPTLGGVIIQYGRLEMLFWLNVPLAVFSFIGCARVIQTYIPARRKSGMLPACCGWLWRLVHSVWVCRYMPVPGYPPDTVVHNCTWLAPADSLYPGREST